MRNHGRERADRIRIAHTVQGRRGPGIVEGVQVCRDEEHEVSQDEESERVHPTWRMDAAVLSVEG